MAKHWSGPGTDEGLQAALKFHEALLPQLYRLASGARRNGYLLADHFLSLAQEVSRSLAQLRETRNRREAAKAS